MGVLDNQHLGCLSHPPKSPREAWGWFFSKANVCHDPWERLFWPSKKSSKIDPSKNIFFRALFFQTRQNDEKDAKSEGHFGSLLGSFFEFFLGFLFSSIFIQ